MEELDGGMIYDSTPGLGPEKKEINVSSDGGVDVGMVYNKTDMDNPIVKVNREKDETFYPNMEGGFEDVREKELPGFIYGRIEQASGKGNLLKSIDHFWKFVESHKDNIEGQTLKEVYALFEEGRAARTDEEVKTFLGKLKSFAGGLERTPIRKK